MISRSRQSAPLRILTTTRLFYLLSHVLVAHSQNELTANPSPGNTILVDDALVRSWDAWPGNQIRVISNIPVTIQLYADTKGAFVTGGHPVGVNDVRVLVTSDCDSTETNLIPMVDLFNTTITVQQNNNTGNATLFLEPSWYKAIWSYTSGWCGVSSTVPNVDLTAEISSNPSANKTSNSSTIPNTDDNGVTTTGATASVEENSSTSTTTTSSTLPGVSVSDTSLGADIRTSFWFKTIITLLFLFTVNIMFSEVNWNNRIFILGKIAITAISLTAMYSTMTQNPERLDQGSRSLQKTCSFNLEILLDGCYYTLDVSAPVTRVVNAVLKNLTISENPDDKCTTDYTGNLTFPVINVTEFSNDVTVYKRQCEMIAEGRPFVDSTGKVLQALPTQVDLGELAWSGHRSVSSDTTSFCNSTGQQNKILGDEWVRRALSEHASVASFATFSIALMTNDAPSALVEDALKAALDEVRHASMSFHFASILTGEEIGAGPLPSSSHEFKQDLTSLALAVASEGCVDETLSTFSAAMEAEDIERVIESGGDDTKYSGVDIVTLSLMKDALKTIAVDESRHSALAWRTLNWICSKNSYACEVVKQEVFDENRMDHRIEKFASLKGLTALQSMKREWGEMYESHRSAVSAFSHRGGGVQNNHSSSVQQLTENIQNGMLC